MILNIVDFMRRNYIEDDGQYFSDAPQELFKLVNLTFDNYYLCKKEVVMHSVVS